MEILTKDAKALQKVSKRNAVQVSICKDTIYISSQAVEDFKFEFGIKIVFVVDMGRLYFFIAKDGQAGGFKLGIASNYGVKAGKICSRLLCKVLHERFPLLLKNGNRTHPVRFSNTQINECLTFEILVNKKP
jgi:hypothetical protein